MKTKKPLMVKFAFDDDEPAFVSVAEVIEANIEQLVELRIATGDREPLRRYISQLAQMNYEQMAEEYPRELAKAAKARKAEGVNERLRWWFDRAYQQLRTHHSRKRIGSGLLLGKATSLVENNTKPDDPERQELLGLLNDYRARIYLKNRQ